MMRNSNFIPSILLAELYFPWVSQTGFIRKQIENVIDEGFYQSIETAAIADKQERRRIFQLVDSHKLYLTQWLTASLMEERLSLSALDEEQRRRAVVMVKQHLPLAAECGAATIALISGDDPGEAKREPAMLAFMESIDAICSYAKQYAIQIAIEPLDRFAHKKKLIGPLHDTLRIFHALCQSHDNLGLAFDSAHTVLNEEDLHETLSAARGYISQIHLSNAMMDKSSKLYGDYHMAPGAPGFLSVEVASDILRTAQRVGLGNGNGLRVAVEARAAANEAEHAMAQCATEFLKAVLQSVAQNARRESE